MKAVILAAGRGTRMGKYTENLPKGMLEFNGKTLIERNLEILRETGINELIIATGYRSDLINYEGVKYYHNPNYASTNMLETLFCAREEFDSDILIVYSDILFTKSLVEGIKGSPGNIVVAVDSKWRAYWKVRYGTTEQDLETLTIACGRIVELGKETDSSEGIEYRYIGVIKITQGIWKKAIGLYFQKKETKETWNPSGREFRQGYITDFLNELIGEGVEVTPSVSEHQWLEFDTEKDYEVSLKGLKDGTLSRYFDIQLNTFPSG